MKNLKIVALIPARSGSTGLAKKNIKKLHGKPLIQYSIDAAKNCPEISDVFLSSDSDEYLELAKALGAKTVKRPDNLSTNDTSMQLVVKHFIESMHLKGIDFDAVNVLFPVYPTRTSEDLSEFINHFSAQVYPNTLIGLKTPYTHPYLCYERTEEGNISSVLDFDGNSFYRRQDYPEHYEITHWSCVIPIDQIDNINSLLINKNSIGYRIPNGKNIVNIDTIMDFKFAEFLLNETLK